MVNRKGLGQANILRTNNNTSTGYGIAYADEVSGHRTVANLTALYALNDWQLSASGDNTDNDAIGQLWYVVNADGKNSGAFYQLKDWSKRKEAAGWSEFKGTGASTAEQEIIYDVSARNDGAVFESLQALLSSSNLSTLIPTSVRHGGMSIRFVQSSDNKYVQYRLMTTSFSTAPSDWQGVDNEPTTGSMNLVKSGGVAEKLSELVKEIGYGVSSYEQSALTLTGYINNEGRIIAGDAYRHSEHIPIAKGQTASVVGKTVTTNVHIFAAYNSDGELLDLFTHTGSYKLEEHTYTATSDGEYIIICSDTSQLADLSLSISAIGLKKEIFEIKEDATTIKSTIKAINGNVENLRESLQETSTIVNNIISKNVSQFYMNAWVRYDDGLISSSSGGAKLYIVDRDSIGNADKLYIHTCSQNGTFAAVSFYSSKIPSQETYLKDISIQGIKSSVGYDIEVDLTDGWQSALILNMSQLDANYSCIIKDSNLARKEELISTLEKVKELETTIKDPTNKFFYEMSPFVEKPFIHHLNQENNSAIPAQSLLDISYAKRLGCNMIEINPHKCSDGVIVCKHGSGGALGVGLISADGNDYSNTQFSSVTSNWLRENISYAKVEGLRIPTLDEFCSVCKQESMMVRVGQNIDVNALNTIRKYLPDNMIYIDSFTSRANGTFRGIIGRIWNPSSKSIDNFLEDIKDVGKPLDVVIASGTFDSLSDDALSHAVQECHKKGYTITMTYPNVERSIRALKFGIDTILSDLNLTNQIHFGNEKNVFVGDNDITLDGATMVDGKIQMPKASSIIIPCSKTIKNGVVSLRIRYSGTISSSCGASSGLNNHVSNGESFINLTLAIEDGTNWLHIVANENSVIYDMQVRCSRI